MKQLAFNRNLAYICITEFIKRMIMELKQRTLADNQMEFAIIALEAAAKKMSISPSEMHRRLQKQDLIKKRLFRHYDLLHTQSIQWVADDLIETLTNWEAEDEEKKGRVFFLCFSSANEDQVWQAEIEEWSTYPQE